MKKNERRYFSLESFYLYFITNEPVEESVSKISPMVEEKESEIWVRNFIVIK